MSITTKTGDQGQTSIGSKRADKDHLFLEVIGDIDELQSVLGVAKTEINNEELRIKISEVQKDLYVISGEIVGCGSKFDYENKINVMEKEIERLDKELPPLKDFLIFGENKSEALIQWSRSIARRVERRVVSLVKQEKTDPVLIRYFNRLSDYLFMIARTLSSGNKTFKN